MRVTKSQAAKETAGEGIGFSFIASGIALINAGQYYKGGFLVVVGLLVLYGKQFAKSD